MIFKKLIQKFNMSDTPLEEKFETAKMIVAKFDFETCEQISEEELKISIQAILFIIFMSHGLPPTASLFFSEILADVTICKIKKAEEIFDFLKAKYVSEWYEIQDFSDYVVE